MSILRLCIVSCPIMMLYVMSPESGTTSRSIENVLSWNNVGSMSSGTVAHPIGLNLPPTDMNSPPRLAGLIFNPRLFAASAEINPFPVQQASTRTLIIRGSPLLHFARPTVVGCLLLVLDFPSTENSSGPRDSELIEYCSDQLDRDSMESMLKLLD